MKGLLVPVVLLPRYTTFLEAGTFYSVPLNVEMYCRLAVTVWRGYMPGSSPSFTFVMEDSHDGVAWASLNGSGNDPGANAAADLAEELLRRWLRVKVVVGGTSGPGVTCFAVGNLEQRTEG